MNNIFTDPMTLYFCSFILLIAVCFWFALIRHTAQITGEIKRVNKKISEYTYSAEVDDDGELISTNWEATDASAMQQNFSKIDKLIKETSSLKITWDEYCNTLQQPYRDFSVSEYEEPKLRNTVSASTLFTFSNVISNKLNLRIYTSIPNILTGLGLLFTFIGLMMGIGGAATGLSSGDIAAAKASLTPLLQGASIAFTTSVVGLALSMLYSFYEKYAFHKIEKKITAFSNLLTARIKYVDADTFAEMQLTATKAQTTALEGFRVEQQRVTDETIKKVCLEFRSVLLESTGCEFDKMRQVVGEINLSIQANIKALNEAQNNQEKVHELSCKTLKDLTKAVTENLQANLIQLENREEQKSKIILAHFTDSLATMESANLKSAKNVFDALKEMNTDLEIQLQSNIKSVKGVSESLQENLTQLEAREEERTEGMLTRFSNSLTTMESVSAENSKHIFDALKVMNQEFEGQLKKNVLSVQDSTESTAAIMMQNMRVVAEENATQMTESMQRNIGSVLDNLEINIKSSTEILNPLLEKLPNFADKMEKANVQLHGITKEQFILTTNIRNTFSEVNSAGDRLAKVVQILLECNQQTLESNRTYADIVGDIKATVSSMKESANEVKITSDNFIKMSESQKIMNTQIDKKIESVFHNLNNGLSQYSNQTNEYMQSLDGHTVQISGHLVEAINELKMSVDDLKRKELAS